MKYVVMSLQVLGWLAAVAFTTWALWTHGHPGWACAVALVGAALVTTAKE